MLQHYIVGIYVWHVICMCMLSHSITSIKKNIGPDVLGISNFSTLVNLIGLLWLQNPQSCPCWNSGPIRISLSLLGPKLLLGLNCNSLQFWPVGPVHSPIRKQFSGPKSPFGPICNFLQNCALWSSLDPLRKQFSGPDSNFWFLKVQNNFFGPVLDFGLNLIEAQQPLENPNN